MTVSCNPTSADAFEAKYRALGDPWNFANSTYEQARYDAIMASLRRARYAAAYEPGCSIGELTARLSDRCDQVLANDLSPTAIAHARIRCDRLSNVRLSIAREADEIPAQAVDLIVFSEIGYYFDLRALTDYASRLANALTVGGEFVAVHWLGHSVDHRLHGDTVHDQLINALPLAWVAGKRHPGFRIDTWVRHA